MSLSKTGLIYLLCFSFIQNSRVKAFNLNSIKELVFILIFL
jgi:hypothetical protein